MLGQDVVGAAVLHGDAAGDEAGGGVGANCSAKVSSQPSAVRSWHGERSPLGLRNEGREPARPSREARLVGQPTGRAGRGQEEAVSVITATSFVGDSSSMPGPGSGREPASLPGG